MKTLLTTVGLATAFALAPFAGQVRAQDDSAPPQAPAQSGDSAVSFQTFYDQLADQGTWINSDQYGYVFQPTENDPNWRPYTYGHWVNTDAGMTWVSDDSFGWATDHYGRWANLDGVGWVWVPGYTWAPAWVSWRDGSDDNGEDVGWAPLPPDSDVGIDYYGNNDFGGFNLGFGFHIGNDCDVAYGIGPACYNFCPVAYIGDRDAWRHFRDRHDNFAFIGRTRNVTNINFRRDGAGRFGHVRETGLDVARLNERAHNRIATAQLTSVNGRNEAGLRGNTLGVFAPRVDRNTVRTARPGEVTRSVAHAGVNRGTDINRPLAVNSSVRPENATTQQIHAARVAQTHESASARIATANTRIAHPLTQPLTAMRTDTHTASNAANPQRFNHPAPTAAQTQRAFTGESRFTGEPATAQHQAVVPATGSSFAGVSGQRHDVAASTTQPAARRDSAFTGESHFTGEPSSQRAAANVEPRVMHQAVSPQGITPTRTEPVEHRSAFAGEANRPASVFHPTTSPVYHPQASAPMFHESAPVYHPQASAPAFHQSAPAFHQSAAPAFHPQATFHPSAPAPQVHAGGGGGGFHSAPAPAAHAGGGGGGAAHVAAAAPGAKH